MDRGTVDRLVSQGWECLRLEVSGLQVGDILLPAIYKGFGTILEAVTVTSITSTVGAHCVGFLLEDRPTKWFRLHQSTEVVLLRCPRKPTPITTVSPDEVYAALANKVLPPSATPL